MVNCVVLVIKGLKHEVSKDESMLSIKVKYLTFDRILYFHSTCNWKKFTKILTYREWKALVYFYITFWMYVHMYVYTYESATYFCHSFRVLECNRSRYHSDRFFIWRWSGSARRTRWSRRTWKKHSLLAFIYVKVGQPHTLILRIEIPISSCARDSIKKIEKKNKNIFILIFYFYY